MSQVLTEILTIVSAAGSIASIVGIYITLHQVRTVKKISKQTHQEINKTDAISDISKCNAMIKECIPLLKQDNFETALIKMRDVKDMVVKLKVIAKEIELSDYKETFDTNVDLHIKQLSNNINTIDDNYKSPALLNKTYICKAMDELSSFIVETQVRITTKISAQNNGNR